jgi:predicted RNase H-like HicB family nuclease
MKPSARYVKIVEWSDEDNCYVGSCPGLFYGGCHGDDERLVFSELVELVEELIEVYEKDGKPLPSPTAGKDYANTMLRIA